VDVPAWSLLRGRGDGENWAINCAAMQDLVAWAEISDFEHYMGAMPFPYDNDQAVEFYEKAKSDALAQSVALSHQYYATGFLEAVYEVCRSKLGLDR
jgi:hypothetical protein